MKETPVSGRYYFDETKNRYFKVLPGHCNNEEASFLTPSKAKFLESTEAARLICRQAKAQNIAISQWRRQTEGFGFKNTDLQNYSVCRLAIAPVTELQSRFRWSTIETVLLPPKKLEPVAIFQNDRSEVTLRFFKLQKDYSQSSRYNSRTDRLKLVECHPFSVIFGDVIDPCINTNPYRLIFAQMSGLERVSSSIVLHDIEHGYDENLSFGSREIWACSWSKKLQQLGIGSRRSAYCLDPETRAVQPLSTNSQDVLAQAFGSAKSAVRNLLFNGCRNGHVIANDLRLASKPLPLVTNSSQHPTSIVSVLCSPVDDHQIIVADKSGNVCKWDLRNTEQPLGEFCRPGKLKNDASTRYQLSHNGCLLYASSCDKAVEIWCTATNKLLSVITLDDPTKLNSYRTKLKTAALLSDPNVNSEFCTAPALFLGTTSGMCLIR